MFAAVLLLLPVLPAALGRPAYGRRDLVVRGQLEAPPVGFVATDIPATGSIKLTVAMHQNNIDGLHSAVLDISDPTSPNYRKHLSKSEVISVARSNR